MSRLTYQVFLSFSDTDTGKSFTDHLYAALLSLGIHAFRHGDEQLDQIQGNSDSESEKAIEDSRISVIVFSRNYVSSHRCLDELVKVMKRTKSSGCFIVPVYYDVIPSELTDHDGAFEQAFRSYQTQFSDDQRREKVNQWMDALSQVTDFGGFVLRNRADRHEVKFIQEIVKDVERKLNRKSLSVAKYPVGLDSRVKSINLWLQDGSTDVGIMGIYGMGGVGKSTIAKTVYNLNYDRFDGSSFVANIRQVSEQPRGLARLQRQLLSDILKKKVKPIYNVDEGILVIKDAIACRRVLIVLDDVDELYQLNAVLGMRKWFYPGSKIIITTRHERLLKAREKCELYKVRELDAKEALQLFSWHAFRKDHPSEGFTGLSMKVVCHCGGVPLAVQVLGSSLCGRNLETWGSALKKLQSIAEDDIVTKLRISFDSLLDDHDRNLFLDIASFFVGKDTDYVETVLEECGYHTIVGIQSLVDKCLLAIDENNKLLVHPLLQDMGREIIRQESARIERRSIIWSHRDSFTVLREKSGTGEIRGLVLDMKMLKEVKPMGTSPGAKRRSSERILEKMLLTDPIHGSKRRRVDFFGNAVHSVSKVVDDRDDFETDAFARMQNLRLLKLSHVQVHGHYEDFPKSLRWLDWRGFTLKSLPDEFPLESLVSLDMRRSGITEVWKGAKFLGSLKILNLSHCHGLKKFTDFSGVPNLKRLILKDCVRLVELHESLGGLTKLMLLNLSGCRSLRHLPSQIDQLKSLEKLILSGCSKLAGLPMELGKLESLTVLHADEIATSQLNATPDEVRSWRTFFPSWLSRPRNSRDLIRCSMASLSRSLLSLSLANCNLTDDDIPADLRSLSLLRYLNLSGNPIRNFPRSVIDLSMLRDLWLDSCTALVSLPELPTSLIDLKTVNCTSLERITNLPNLLKSLFLDVSGCEKLEYVEGAFRLEPIENFSTGMVSDLGLCNLDALKIDAKVELYNKLTDTRLEGEIKGLYEFGIFSTFVPGNEVVPGWYSINKCAKTSVSFVLPCSDEPDIGVKGLSVCVVYGRCSSAKKFEFWSNGNWWCTFYIRVCNVTKGLKYVYGPTFVGVPRENEDMTFLSHWKLGKQMEVGDDVTVSLVCWSPAFQLKGFDTSLVYYDSTTTTTTNHLSYHGDGTIASLYQLQPGHYFLTNSEYLVLREPENGAQQSVRTRVYDKLFDDDCIEARGGTQEDDDDDFYDFPKNSDEEVGDYDEDDDEWLNALL